MRILRRDIIKSFCKKHSGAKSSLQAWLYEVEKAEWLSSEQVLNQYKSVDFTSNDKVIFHLSNYTYKLVIIPVYRNKTLVVDRIGTTPEFNNWDLR